jgi:gas vesicle protein GvpO
LADNRNGKQDGKLKPAELVRSAARTLAELTGRPPENVLGLRRDDDGWKVTLEVVELHRVPHATDVLGCYVVTVDDDGELVSYERQQRYIRSQTGGDQ